MYLMFGKRLFDVSLALIAIVGMGVVMLMIISLYIFLFQLPVFFVQQRIGRGERTFELYKFRTLSNNQEVEWNSRRFLFGDLLRSLSLDELPQLWNVLKGNMSIIGPRPLPVEYLPLFSDKQRERHQIRPGITGWAQVNGRHSISWKQKFELDNYYVHHISFGLDLLILFKTIVLLLSFRKDNSLAEQKFTGN